ncbi:MAG: choice-of-anchor D domain-containing protein [Deltaproteobacteria bacterium]|nr:choice-of-anchor D domain-containing protein [Deltaproteobacteria bacterium]
MWRTAATLFAVVLVLSGCGQDELRQVVSPPAAIAALAPRIFVEPAAYEFANTEVGALQTQQFQIGNVGNATLTISELTLSGAGATSYAIGNDHVSGRSIEPNSLAAFSVTFAPRAPGSAAAVVEVSSNDPTENPLQVELLGQSIVSDGPVARCSVSPGTVHPPFEAATFSGAGSTDPNGYAIVSYSWRLQTKPAGSAAVMPACSATADCGPFIADLAGTYVGELTVTNEIGLTGTCIATLQAVPTENLWVEMYWTQANDDMDLHLVAPGGTLRSGTDCYFMNCVGGLSWGQAGAGDDPALDLDDINGTGPENINITAPAAGTYTVYVHDYPESPYTGANSVTVKVYVAGAVVFTDVRSISGEDTTTPFCSISWPSGVVTRL